MGLCRVGMAKIVVLILILGVVSVQLTLVLSAPPDVQGVSSDGNLRGAAPAALEDDPKRAPSSVQGVSADGNMQNAAQAALEDPEKARHDEIRDSLVADFKARLERDAANVTKSALILDLERVEQSVPDAHGSERCLHALKLLQPRWPAQAQELIRQHIEKKKTLSGALASLTELGLWGELLGGSQDGFLEGEFFDVSCDYTR